MIFILVANLYSQQDHHLFPWRAATKFLHIWQGEFTFEIKHINYNTSLGEQVQEVNVSVE